MTRMRRGRRYETQCQVCKRILTGPQANKNPRKMVNYTDENGFYVNRNEAKAKGVDLRKAKGITHGTCKQCANRIDEITEEAKRIGGHEGRLYLSEQRQEFIKSHDRPEQDAEQGDENG